MVYAVGKKYLKQCLIQIAGIRQPVNFYKVELNAQNSAKVFKPDIYWVIPVPDFADKVSFGFRDRALGEKSTVLCNGRQALEIKLDSVLYGEALDLLQSWNNPAEFSSTQIQRMISGFQDKTFICATSTDTMGSNLKQLKPDSMFYAARKTSFRMVRVHGLLLPSAGQHQPTENNDNAPPQNIEARQWHIVAQAAEGISEPVILTPDQVHRDFIDETGELLNPATLPDYGAILLQNEAEKIKALQPV